MVQKQKKENITISNSEIGDIENGNQESMMDDISSDMKKKDDILQYFYDISSIDNDSRVRAITKLIETLQEIQKEFKPSDHADISRYVPKVIEKSKISNELLSPELNYSIKRLVLGLGSNRDSTRFGFSLALSEVLHSFKLIQLPWFFDYLCNLMDLTGKDLGEKESHFGRLFGIMSIVKSSRLGEFKIQQTQPTKSISYNANRPDSENIIECLVEQLLYFPKKRPTYSELSFEILISLLDQMSEKQIETLWAFIKPIIPKSPEQYSADLLSLILFISKRFKNFNITKNTGGWNHQSLFNKLNIKLLTNSLIDSSKAHPRVHKVWTLAFENILTSTEKDTISISEFWSQVVEEHLLKSSSNRCYLGLQLFEMLLPITKPEIIKDIFSPNVAYNLCLSLKPTSPLHEIGVLAFQVIPKTAEISQKHRLALMIYFSSEGKNHFDNHVCCDILTELIKGADEESVQLYLNHLYADFYDQEKPNTLAYLQIKDSQIFSSDKDVPENKDDETFHLELDEVFAEENYEKLVDSQRIWVLNQVSILSKEISKKRDLLISLESPITNLLKFIFFHSYFQPSQEPTTSNKKSSVKVDKFLEELYKKKPVPELSQSVRDACFLRFSSIMEDLSTHSLQDPSKGSLDGTMSNGEFWSNKVVNFQYELMANPSPQKPSLLNFVGQGIKPLEKLLKQIKSIQSIEKPAQQQRGFELLFLQISLQYLSEPTEMSEIVEDIMMAYDELTNPKKTKSKKGVPEKPAPFMIILDILISLLDQPSSLLRTVIKQIFSMFFESISFQVLEYIISMIKASSEELFQDTYDDEEEEDDDLKPFTKEELEANNKAKEEEDDEDDDEEEDDEEMNGKDNDEDDDEDDDEEMDDEDMDEDLDDDYVDPEFVKKLKAKLGDHLLLSDDEDDEGLAMPTLKQAQSLNNTLSSLLGNKSEKKITHYDIKTKSINLKIRLLDLLETYIKKFSQNPTSYIFKMIPLMIDACSNEEPAISNRFISLFKNKLSLIRSANESEINSEDLNKLLGNLFDNLLLSTQPKPKQTTPQKNHKKSKKVDPSTLTAAEKNPFVYLLSGQALYMVVRVLISMKHTPETTTTSNGNKNTKKTQPATPIISSDFGKMNVQLFNSKFNTIIDHLTDRSNVVPTTFFSEFSQRFPGLVWMSMNKIIGLLDHAQNDFALVKVLDYIGNLMKKRDPVTIERITEHYPLLFKTSIELIKSSKSEENKLKFKPQSYVQLLNTLLTSIQIISPSVSSDKLKSNMPEELEIQLLELCKASAKQALRDTSKRILKLVGMEDNKLVQMDKRKRQKKEKSKKQLLEQRKEESVQLKKETKENILRLKEERRASQSTSKKVENKIKSRPKKKEEEIENSIVSMNVDDDDIVKEETEEVVEDKKPSKKKFKTNNDNNNNTTPTKISKKKK